MHELGIVFHIVKTVENIALENQAEKGRGGCEEEKISWTVQEEPAAGGDACYGNASWNEYYIGLCR